MTYIIYSVYKKSHRCPSALFDFNWFLVLYRWIVQQINAMEEKWRGKRFSESNWWWWLKGWGRNRGGDEKNLGWQDETGEEEDPTRWGAWEAVCSVAWLTHNCSAAAGAPPRVWRNSTRRTHCEQANTPVHTAKMTGRNTQKDRSTQAYGEEEK